MGITPTQPTPCAPALNLVQNGAAGSPFPPVPTDIPEIDSNPGFTDLANSILDDLAAPDDGWDTLISDATGFIDGWDAAEAAQDADLDTILVLLAQTDPTPMSDALNEYEAAFPGENDLVTGLGEPSLPQIGAVPTMWVAPLTVIPAPAAPGGGEPLYATEGDPPYVFTFTRTLPATIGGGLAGISAHWKVESPVITWGGISNLSAPYELQQLNSVGQPYMQLVQDATCSVIITPYGAAYYTAKLELDFVTNDAQRHEIDFTVRIEPKPAA